MILKRKYRYVLAESTVSADLMDRRGSRAFCDSLLGIMGEKAYADADPRVVWQDGSMFIMKVNRNSEKSIILALSFLKSLSGQRAGFYTLKTSGTIRSLKDLLSKGKPLD